MGSLWIITGPRGSGKTSFCQKLINQARSRDWGIAGILSPARFEGGVKVGIDAVDLRSGARCPLATLAAPGTEAQIQTETWAFNERSLAWGNQIFNEAVPCDLLVVDEIGPLELVRGIGWTNAIAAVNSAQFRVCLLVLRPELLLLSKQYWPHAHQIKLPPVSRGSIHRSGSNF